MAFLIADIVSIPYRDKNVTGRFRHAASLSIEKKNIFWHNDLR